jgi:hypothetical protein
MEKYYLKAIILQGCPYSNNAVKLLKEHKIISDIEYITYNNKELYKTDKIQTFPQIYLKKYNSNQHLLLGGHDDLSNFISTFLSQKLTAINLDTFNRKYNWSKKATLRLIQLINNHN